MHSCCWVSVSIVACAIFQLSVTANVDLTCVTAKTKPSTFPPHCLEKTRGPWVTSLTWVTLVHVEI
jgi:hypothetical protein